MSFFEELKRRNVVRVGIAYVLLGWVVMQGADFMLDLVGAPEWVIRVFAIAGLVGLPFALFFAWAFELTPEGIKRESEVDRSQTNSPDTGKKLNGVIIGLLLAVILLMGIERLFFAGGSGPESAPATAEVKAPKTIAVLPFADLSQAQDQGWFADGLAEEILNALVRVPDLSVAARTSSFTYKGSSKDISEIAAELGVAHVLEGSVRSSADRIRVTAQLIRASDGFHLWSENYDRDVADMISIQEDLASNIAMALETTMDPEALAKMAQAGTGSIEAYQEYLRGLQLQTESNIQSDDRDGLKVAYEHFERARAIDPTFAEAQLQAAAYWKVELTPTRTSAGSSGLEPQQMLAEYNERISLAIENAKSEADRLRNLADRAMIDLRLRDSRRLFEQYLEMRPNDEQARSELETVLTMMSETMAVRTMLADWEAKGETDSYAAVQYINNAYRVLDASEAADFGLQALQRWPTSTSILYQTHRTLVWAGRYREASEVAARYDALVPGGNPMIRAREACAAGDRAGAEKVLDELESGSYRDLTSLWLVYNMLGNEQQQVELLRPLEQSGIPFQLASFLVYHKFDPRPFPSLMTVLEREGVRRPAPVVPPFRCPPPAVPSVAVLPFLNMSADAEQEYFSDGITEEIINALVRVPGIKVAARTSVFAFKGQEKDIRAIGDELDVTHVVEGSVRSDGKQLRITAQLIQVKDGFHLWSETFDRERANVFAIQEEIAAAIAGVLNEQLGAKTVQQEAPRISVQAYDDYLRGRAHLRARSEADLEQAYQLFLKVTEVYPDYAPAWAALAITADVTDQDAVAERAAQRALAIDPDNVDALDALGSVYRDAWRWQEAEALFNRALAIDPDSAELLEDVAEFMASTGRVKEQLELAGRGYAIDPYLDPLVDVYAGALITAGQNGQALDVWDQALARGGAEWLRTSKLLAYFPGGDAKAMHGLIERLELPANSRAVALAVLDDPGNPQLIEDLRAARPTGPIDNAGFDEDFTVEFVLLYLGEVEPVLDTMQQRLSKQRSGNLEAWFMPHMAGLRAHPRFAELLLLTGLPAYWDQAGWPEFCARSEDGVIQCH